MTKPTPKNLAKMFKEFHSAWKGRDADYREYMGLPPKKKKKKKK